MMKRWMLMVLALCLAVLPALAEEQADVLAERAEVMAQRLDALADSEDYLSIMGGSQALADLIRAWGEGDHAAPRMILRADWSEETDWLSWLAEQMEDFTPSDVVRAELSRRLPMSLAGMLNAAEGTEALAAASLCTTSTVFACEADGAGLYLLSYDAGAPVLVTWYASDGAVFMQAAFLANEAVAEKAMDGLKELDLPLTVTVVD